MHNSPSDRQIFSVSDLNRSVGQLLETHLPSLWVEGEISNFAQPASGHWYLSLKDDRAQVRCAMFRNVNQRVGFQPVNGNQVLVRCRVGLYEGRGDYQLIIEQMEEAGFGALQRRFEQLKQQLAAEGLFDAQNKQSMPDTIRHIGVITSPTGAVVKDIISVLKRRFPTIKISLFATAVQGDQAAEQIIEALGNANQYAQCDALILSRGGGSLEDLWPFNEESVARAIVASETPVVSAVGHEVDFTIADFVADLRAPTASAAAELLSPDGQEMLNRFAHYQLLLIDAIERHIKQLGQQCHHLHKRLQHPGQRLQQQAQYVDHLHSRVARAMTYRLKQQHSRLENLQTKLFAQHPRQALVSYQQQLINLAKQLSRNLGQQLQRKQTRTTQAMHLLDTVSPLNTMERGYAIIRNTEGAVISSVSAVTRGDQLQGQLRDGEILFEVTDSNKKPLVP